MNVRMRAGSSRALRPCGQPIWAVLVLLGGWCAGCATVTATPEQRAGIEADKRVALVAPQVEVMRYSADGQGEPVESEEARVAAKLGADVAEQLSRRGFTVSSAPVNRAAASSIGDVYERIAYLYGIQAMPARFDRFNRVYLDEMGGNRMIANPSPQPDYMAGFAPGAAPLAAQEQVDALVFVRFDKFERSAGSIAKEAAVDFAVDMVAAPITLLGGGLKPAPYTGGTLTVTFIDGKTGNVLWGNRVGYYGNIPMGENLTLSDTVSGAFATFPPSGGQ